MNESRNDWECVQDAELARRPQPERLPTDEPDIPEPESAIPPSIEPTITFETEATPAAVDTVEETQIPPTPPVAPEPASGEPAGAEQSGLMALSGDMFAVQLMAVANESLADEFISDYGLQDTLTILMAREDDLYYVVLLGVFESFADAQYAVDHRPQSLADVEPWIRSLSSIQEGARDAQSLLAVTE
jgi:septal ring-binding cell division protein DamX